MLQDSQWKKGILDKINRTQLSAHLESPRQVEGTLVKTLVEKCRSERVGTSCSVVVGRVHDQHPHLLVEPMPMGSDWATPAVLVLPQY